MNDSVKTLIILTVMPFLITGCSRQNETVQKNEAIARQYIEAWNNYDSLRLAALFSGNFKYEDAAFDFEISANKDSLISFVHGVIVTIPDSRFETTSIIANDSMVVVEWIWKGKVPKIWFPNDSITKEYFTARGTSVMEIQNGLIMRNTDYYNGSSLH